MCANPLRFVHPAVSSLALVAAILPGSVFCSAQNSTANPDEPRGMIATEAGFVALDTPKGWVQAEGPGLAFFLPEGADPGKAEASIYLSASPIGPREEDKDLKSAIQSDIAGFKQHFPNGLVRAEEPLSLPRVKDKAEVYAFESGEQHNAFERTAYIGDVGRVWMITVSAKSSDALAKAPPAFHSLVQSYGGSILMGAPPSK